MGNKLKDVFSNEAFDMGVKLQFSDKESKKQFSEALERVFNEGETVAVNGVTAISTTLKIGESKLPFSSHENLNHVMVGPSPEPIPRKIKTGTGEREVTLYRIATASSVVIETDKNAPMWLRLTRKIGSNTIRFSFQSKFNEAESIAEITECLHDIVGIINILFFPDNRKNQSEESAELKQMLKSILITSSYFDKLRALEKELQISFLPSDLTSFEDDSYDVYELYFLLVEKKAIRLNAKLTSTTSTGITLNNDFKEHELGVPLDLTFTGTATYTICGQSISLYTANLLTNAIITDIQTDDKGTTRLLYGDTDSDPMYISYTGYKMEEDAKVEMKALMEKKDWYTGAKTIENLFLQETTMIEKN